MFTLTINANTPEEMTSNLERLLTAIKGFIPAAAPQTNATPAQPIAPPPAAAIPSAPPTAPPVAQQQPPVVPPVASAPPPAAPQTPPAPAVPVAAAPTYTLDALAKAGATLAQSGKMEQALALLAKYGVQTVNQLQPEQYGAFATELRALGAQV